MDRLPFASEGVLSEVADMYPASHEGVAFKLFFHVGSFKRERGGAVRFSPKSELSLRQGISLQTSHPAEDVPTTVPHSGRESSRRAAPLCETALSFARPDNDDAPWIRMPDAALQSGLNSKGDQ
jgi:hypothetical protein